MCYLVGDGLFVRSIVVDDRDLGKTRVLLLLLEFIVAKSGEFVVENGLMLMAESE